MNQANDTMDLSEFMEMSLHQHRQVVADEMAELFHQPCPVCEGTWYLADAGSIPCRDEDDEADDFVAEIIVFVCAACGTVFSTDHLVIHHDTQLTGWVEPDMDDPEFVQYVREQVGFEP